MTNTDANKIVREDCAFVLQQNAEILSPLKKSNLLVTGGTGFVGTWIAELITTLNDQFNFGVNLSLLARGTESFKERAPHLAGRKDISLIRSDTRKLIEIPKNTNWLIHAAATPDTRTHSTDPMETLSVIARGTESVLRSTELCSDFRMFLNLSTGLVYGDQPWECERIAETAPLVPATGSLSPAYAEAKLYAETFCHVAANQMHLPVVTLRPFSFVGPYQSLEGRSAVSAFIRDAISGNPIRILGDGQTVRSYLHGAEMAFFMLRTLTGAKSGNYYNLGSSEAVTLQKLAEEISNHFNPRPEIRLRAGIVPITERSRFVPDTSKLQKELGLTQRMDLKNTLSRSIAWVKASQGKK